MLMMILLFYHFSIYFQKSPHPLPSQGYFTPPTVFTSVTDNMKISREEIFGPVAVIMKFKTIDEVVARANDTEYGLGSAIHTTNATTATKVGRELKAGVVWVNCYGMLLFNFIIVKYCKYQWFLFSRFFFFFFQIHLIFLKILLNIIGLFTDTMPFGGFKQSGMGRECGEVMIFFFWYCVQFYNYLVLSIFQDHQIINFFFFSVTISCF